MRDIIWTIIILWVVWRVVDAFKKINSSAKKVRSGSTNQQNFNSESNFQSSPKKGELKPDAGEYVDYEEVKK